MPRTTPSVNRSRQTTATAAAKLARVEEAGLGGRRIGKASATTRAAQAQRDTRQARTTEQKRTAAKVKSPKHVPGASLATLKKAPVAKKTTAAAQRATAKARVSRSTPLVEVRTSSSVAGSAKLDAYAESVVTEGLSRFAARLTRIDVYLDDENAEKKGQNDKSCQIEARPASAAPVSATAAASTLEKALSLALGKMKRLLSTHFDKRSRR